MTWDKKMCIRDSFEYALGAADDIANKIKQTTDEYINTILPPLTKALFKYCLLYTSRCV